MDPITIERNMGLIENSNADKAIIRMQLIQALKDNLKEELIMLKKRKQIVEKLEAIR